MSLLIRVNINISSTCQFFLKKLYFSSFFTVTSNLDCRLEFLKEINFNLIRD